MQQRRMHMPKVKSKIMEIPIEKLIVNPENKRYVENRANEIDAIRGILSLDKSSKDEMIALATDIAVNGLNEFELPIVWEDEEEKSYLVVEGNRRISAIKLMTQYRECDELKAEFPSVYRKLNSINYSGDSNIRVSVYADLTEANKVLPKIHNDVNGGIGRKQWSAYAKERYRMEEGLKTKVGALIDFLEHSKYTDPELLKSMAEKRWTSKLERVVSFAVFPKYYGVTFDDEMNLIYKDTEKHFCKMLSNLVYDLISNKATGFIRLKSEFENYYSELPDEFKSKVVDSAPQTTPDDENKEIPKEQPEENADSESKASEQPEESSISPTPDPVEEDDKPKKRKNISTSAKALRLSRNYSDQELSILHEKGKDITQEMESLNVWQYPYAATSLCRELIELTLDLWIEELQIQLKEDSLEGRFKAVLNELQNKKLYTNTKHHSMLNKSGIKNKFLVTLSAWMHGDDQQCVQVADLLNGWKGCRLLIERYIEYKKESEK